MGGNHQIVAADRRSGALEYGSNPTIVPGRIRVENDNLERQDETLKHVQIPCRSSAILDTET